MVEQTRIGDDDEGVFVKPSIVVEVTYQEVQETDEYMWLCFEGSEGCSVSA